MNTRYSLMTVYNPTSATASGKTLQIVFPEQNKNIFHRLGKTTGKAFSFFRKAETKTAALISYWAVETLLFALIMLAATSSLIFLSALFLYLYGTYAIFSAVNALTK